MYPDEFIGSEVEIDGEVAGELKMFGNATRTAFQVKDGKHTVKIRHPEYASEEWKIDSGVGGRNVMIILDFQNRYVDGESEVLIARQ